MTQLPQRRLHLPHPFENLLYILALALSPLGNHLLQMLVLGQYQKALGDQRVWLHGAINASYALLIGGTIPALLTLLLRTSIHRSADVRRVLGGNWHRLQPGFAFGHLEKSSVPLSVATCRPVAATLFAARYL